MSTPKATPDVVDIETSIIDGEEAITITRAGQPGELLKHSDAVAAPKNVTFDVPEQGYADGQKLGRISRKGPSPVITNAVSAAKAETRASENTAEIVKDAQASPEDPRL